MNTLIEALPSALTGNWWPRLHLKKGRKLAEILPEQCGKVMEIYRAGRGCSEMPASHIPLYDETGARVGRISYNGRVWLEDIDGDKEVPVSGVKTCAERDAEGWA